MLLLGIDLGTSSVKVSVVDVTTQQCLNSASYPETEAEIISLQPGWAEQDPEQWWQHVKQAILKCHASGKYSSHDIGAIGIAYQMHGLVLVDKQQQVLRNAIIWCDSRAVSIGEKAFHAIGEEECLSHLLNSPGNFTASKLAWVKENERAIYERIDKILLPGDFIAMKLTGECTTTISALSEGIFWDFEQKSISADILRYFGFDEKIFPDIHPVFAPHGYLKEVIASELSMKAGIPIAYKAGDQPNNALSLNVLNAGEVAATAGTSGVIYGVTEELSYDVQSRINSFAHVNHTKDAERIGILLCINGAGSFNRWIKNMMGANYTYAALNKLAEEIPAGSAGLFALPFGNGAERMLDNKIVGAHLSGLDFNIHQAGHLVRAAQEGIAFAFRYGFDIMKENGVNPTVIRAGKTNLFLSEVFVQAFADVNNVTVEFYEGDGSFGAAIGAGIGAAVYKNDTTALNTRKPTGVVNPKNPEIYNNLFEQWKTLLRDQLDKQTGEKISFNVI